MSRNEITLQEMFSSVIGELREGGRWGTAHIYQSAVNAFSVFTKWQPMPMRKLSPTVLKRFEKLPQAEELQLEHRVHLHQDGTLGVSSGGGQKVHTVCTQTVRACVYRHTGRQEEGAQGIRHQQPGKGDGKEPARRDAPKRTAENKDFLVLMFMLRGIPFVDLAYLHKRTVQGSVLSYRRTEDGTGD